MIRLTSGQQLHCCPLFRRSPLLLVGEGCATKQFRDGTGWGFPLHRLHRHVASNGPQRLASTRRSPNFRHSHLRVSLHSFQFNDVSHHRLVMHRTNSHPEPTLPIPAFVSLPVTAALSSRAAATAARRLALHEPVLSAQRAGHRLIAGVDEAGAGPLAGPVVACAVLLHPTIPHPNLPFLDDSKRLSASRRATLASTLLHHPAFIVSFASCAPAEIDALNILQARFAAMSRAVRALPTAPQLLFVDGNRELTDLDWVPQRAVIGGDGKISVVAMASVLAKEWRDAYMRDMHQRFPGYGFAKHVGYPTKMHLERLRELGPSAIHRRSFRPVREAEERMRRAHEAAG